MWHSFCKASQRKSEFFPSGAADKVPGPGTYSNAAMDLQRSSKAFTRIKAGFAAGSDRFRVNLKGAPPGPGTYDGASATTLGKQTFNITYDDHRLNKLL